MEPTEVVLRFLDSMGRRADAEFYLGLFRAEAKERFATIAVDGPVVSDALDAVVLDCRFLRTLGLVPVMVVGHFSRQEAESDATRLEQALRAAKAAARAAAASSVKLQQP
jgi:hypothetical protein